MARRAQADSLLGKTASDLKEMLREAARELDPFPEPSLDKETKKLELPRQDYIPYAYNALCEITKRIVERKELS